MKATPKSLLAGAVLILNGPFLPSPAIAGPGSNAFETATALIGYEDESAVTDIIGFSRQVSEPGHRPDGQHGASSTAWWKWTAPASGFCTVDTFHEGITQPVLDTILAVYTGDSLGSLTAVIKNDNANLPSIQTTLLSAATFRAEAGQTYHIVVDGYQPSAVGTNHRRVMLNLRLLTPRAAAYHALHDFRIGPAGSGITRVLTTRTGAVSVQTRLGNRLLRARGAVHANGYFWAVLPHKSGDVRQPPHTLTLQLAGRPKMRLEDPVLSTFVTTDLFEQERFDATNPNPITGRLNYAMYQTSGIDLQQGGIGTCSISRSGKVRSACRAPDGVPLTWSAVLCKSSRPSVRSALLFHRNTFRGKGHLRANLSLKLNSLEPALESILCDYIRPPRAVGGLYENGLDIPMQVYGGPFPKVTRGERAAGFLQANAGMGRMRIGPSVAEGFSVPVDEPLVFSPASRFEFPEPSNRSPRLTLNTANGFIRGSIAEQDGIRRTIHAVMFRYYGVAAVIGQMSGKKEWVTVHVVP